LIIRLSRRERLRDVAVEIPLVGRAVELDLIRTRLGEAAPPSIVLVGPAGVGKTRLAGEASELANQMGYTTAKVIATRAAASIPLGPFAPLLPDATIGTGGLLGLLRSVADSLLERAEDGRLLVVVDDGHLLDDASAALVHQLAQEAASGLIITVRTPSDVPEPITALWKDGIAERLDITPLTEPEVADFAAGALGGPVAGAAVRRLWELSSGNALYLRELIRGAADSGSLVNQGEIWIMSRPPEAPERLVELIGARLADLKPETTDVVDFLALAGTIGLELLEDLVSTAATEDAERLGLITVNQSGRRSDARLSHPLYGEVRRQHMPAARLRRLRGALADGLAATGTRRREDLLTLASWQVAAGRPGDPDTLVRAAQRARSMFDLDLAIKLGTAAREAGAGPDAAVVVGVSLFTAGRQAEAEEVLAAAAPECTTDEERQVLAGARGYNLSIMMGEPQCALDVIDEAMAQIADPHQRENLQGRVALINMMGGRMRPALEQSEPLFGSPFQPTVVRAHYMSAIALSLLGRTAEGIEKAEQGHLLHRELVDPTQLAESTLVGAALGHLHAGQLEESETLGIRCYTASLEAGDKEGMATFSMLAGWASIQRGRLDAGRRRLVESAAINRDINDDAALRWSLGGVALVEGMARNAAAATAAVEELNQLAYDWAELFGPDLMQRGEAWALVAAGEITAARAVLRDAAARAEALEQRPPLAVVLHDLARLGEPGSVRDRLAELATECDGALVPALAAHAAALANNSGAELDAAAEAFAEIGALLLACEAATSAAAAYTEEGRSRPASASARKAEEYSAMLGIELPDSNQLPQLSELTTREREIATLAADGQSSKDIASKLFISLRTVDNHLQRIYSKLGVNGRDQLKELLAD
jgi:DNA-binding NarL/FixJ family response regulator